MSSTTQVPIDPLSFFLFFLFLFFFCEPVQFGSQPNTAKSLHKIFPYRSEDLVSQHGHTACCTYTEDSHRQQQQYRTPKGEALHPSYQPGLAARFTTKRILSAEAIHTDQNSLRTDLECPQSCAHLKGFTATRFLIGSTDLANRHGLAALCVYVQHNLYTTTAMASHFHTDYRHL